MMADDLLLNGNNDGVGGVDDIFVYTGGHQEVPRDVKRVRIAENIDTIPMRAFSECRELIEVEGHNKIRKIERIAFYYCPSLRRVSKMTGVKEIEFEAFLCCVALSELELGKLEIIGYRAFALCKCLRSINLSSARRVGWSAFESCDKLTDVVFGEDLERIERNAFSNCIMGAGAFVCTALIRITIPLKGNLIVDKKAFDGCHNLSTVDILDGGIHKTISSLHMESWRVELKDEIDRINQALPNIQDFEKAIAIQQWIARVLSRMEHYKSEHNALLKEAMALLELALWKAKLFNQTDEKKCSVDIATKNAKIVTEAARKEHRVTCGANIVIKNVLPFLVLE
jgi:hypothetical protein